ncbi:MAG: HEAT repeat domain-containing protein, partial [Terriglobales bacterium]
QNESGVAYWVAKRKWDKCVEIGAPAVEPIMAELKDSDSDPWVRKEAAEALGKIGDARAVTPLIAALGDNRWGLRQAAANSLVKLYQSNLLGEAHKHLILAQRGRISAGHDDETTFSSSDCHHTDHKDNGGIGVAFPV